MSRLRLTIAALVLTGTAALTGCAADVPMEPAVDANNPACADVTVRLPDTVASLKQRTTNAQATGAWGNPAEVLLRCGIEPSGPTEDSCISVNGVDWIVDESRAPMYRFEAYGRSPGIEVIVNGDRVSGTDAIIDLGAVVKVLPQTRQCLSIDDTYDLPG